MKITEAHVERQLRLGEDSTWEFKRIEFAGDRPRSPGRNDLADEIAAFANAEGGVLLLGVSDAGEAQGMSRGQMDAIEWFVVEICTDAIKPPVRLLTQRGEIEPGKPYLIVQIPRDSAQHDSPGGSFLRVGSTKRTMTSDERLRLAQQRGQARFLWFDEQSVPGTGFGTLDEALWLPLLSAEGRAEPATAMEKMGLLARDEHGAPRATVAGVLFCCKTPETWLPNACITATLYRGADRTTGQLDARTITGPLDQQIAQAVAFAVRNMRVGAHKDPARMDLPQYSKGALIEAVTNAVAHRDYSMRGSRIRLSMFSDRLEIQSPGALANSLTVDELEHRQATRNEVLASIFGRMPTGDIAGANDRRFIMERRGDGIPLIRRATSELAGCPPRFELIGDQELRVTIPAAATEPSPARVIITVLADGCPIADADVLVLFPNKAWKRTATDSLGQAAVELHTVKLPMTVFAAAAGFAAHCEREWVPEARALTIELRPLSAGGAVILPQDYGQIPGLRGSLNPVRDELDRTYLYASKIAIEQGKLQPVHFVLGQGLRLTDVNGIEATVRIVEIAGRSSLVEYRPFAPSEDD